MFNKDIDRLFQEQFKDFEQIPHPKVWKGIEKELTNTPSVFYRLRWIGFVGVLFVVFGLWFIFNTTTNQTVKLELPKDKSTITTTSEHFNTQNNKKVKIVIGSASSSKPLNSPSKEKRISIKTKDRNQLSNHTKESSHNQIKPQKNPSHPLLLNVSQQSKTFVNNTTTQNKFQVVLNNSTTQNKTTKTQSANSERFSKMVKNTYVKPMEIAKLYKPINHLYLVDLSKIKIQLPLSKPLKVKEHIKKWVLGTSFSPIYYSSFSQGSPLDENIASNKQTSSNSYAYGLNVAYKLNKKWSLKTGLFKRNLAYRTADIGVVFQVITNNNIGKYHVSLHNMNDLETSSEDITFVGDLKQELKYVEVPLEIKYQLLNKRLGVNLNGGFSTLFLNGNNVELERSGTNFSLGKASNIRNTSYSLNLGFDTSLRISDKWNYSVSPTFKYHLNTFTDNDGGFKPYSIGFNTGLFYNF